MAKKKLSALMQTIMGERIENTEQPSTVSSQTESISVRASASVVPETTIRRAKGRPRTVSNETVASFKIEKELLMKLKYISLMENSMQKEILHNALCQFFAEWESKHGTIPVPISSL